MPPQWNIYSEHRVVLLTSKCEEVLTRNQLCVTRPDTEPIFSVRGHTMHASRDAGAIIRCMSEPKLFHVSKIHGK